MITKSNRSLGLAAATVLLVGGGAWVVFQRVSPDENPLAVGVTESAASMQAESLPIWDERRLIALCDSDPLEALRLSRQLDNGAERERVLSVALESLKRSNPALAAEIVAGLPAGDFQQIAAGQVATAFAKVDPVAALSWARTLGDDTTRLRAVREVAAAWAESDAEAAAVSMASLGSDRERQLGALAVATVWTRRDPVASLSWAETLQPLDARALIAGSAVQTWAEQDAAAAMDWLARQPAEFHAVIDPDTNLGILGKWAAQDPETVRAFVHAMTPGREQARAVGVVAVQLAKNDPVATMEWALTLPEEAVRNGAFSTAFQQWREVAPQRADAWLQAANFTAEEKLRLVRYP